VPEIKKKHKKPVYELPFCGGLWVCGRSGLGLLVYGSVRCMGIRIVLGLNGFGLFAGSVILWL